MVKKFHRKHFRTAAKAIWDNIKKVSRYGPPEYDFCWGCKEFFSCSALKIAVGNSKSDVVSEYLEAYYILSTRPSGKKPKFWNQAPTKKNQEKRAAHLLLIGELLHGKKIPDLNNIRFDDLIKEYV